MFKEDRGDFRLERRVRVPTDDLHKEEQMEWFECHDKRVTPNCIARQTGGR